MLIEILTCNVQCIHMYFNTVIQFFNCNVFNKAMGGWRCGLAGEKQSERCVQEFKQSLEIKTDPVRDQDEVVYRNRKVCFDIQ